MPDFVEPQLCASVESPPSGENWCHEIKFDGYRVQLRVEGGDAALMTRKGLDWSEKFPAIAKEGGGLDDALIDGEIVAVDTEGLPDFSALQAAIADGKTGNLIFFAFDLLFAGGEDLRALPLVERKERLKQLLESRKGKAEADPLCRAFRRGRRDRAGIGAEAQSRRHHLQAARCALSLRPNRKLDQGQGARRAGGRHRRLEDHARKIPFADGRRLPRQSSRLCRHRRHRLWRGQGPSADAGAEGAGVRQESVQRRECAEEDARRALAKARTRCRDRIRRLDRGRQHPAGGVQGPAAGQAGERGGSGEAHHGQGRKARCREIVGQRRERR